MIALVVGADDRTGALESAGACADHGAGPVRVVSMIEAASGAGAARIEASGGAIETGVVVVDLATRHLDGAGAAARAGALEEVSKGVSSAHKIDSTLRGNWADEVVARHRVAGRRILLVPSLPAVGRICAGGIVYEHGRPVGDGPAGGDARTPVRSSRPADHLRAAGARDVVELAGADQVAAWLAAGGRASLAVCDAATENDLAVVAATWAARRDVVLAGTAAAIGAAAGALLRGRRGTAPLRPSMTAPALVVAGSLHPVARRQTAHLQASGAVAVELGRPLDAAIAALRAGQPALLTSSAPPVLPVGAVAAHRTALALASAAEQIGRAVDVGMLVVIGGDTAAAVLGPGPVLVGGTVAPGTPWGHHAGGGGPLLITRAGGFGDVTALAALVWGRLER